MNLKEIEDKVMSCGECDLSESRTNSVPGEGDPNADLVFIGEAPGKEEDKQGRPFVGRAGNKLMDILNSVNFSREDVFLCNILKCRPPDNRSPHAGEKEACFPYLEAQIATVNPDVIVTLGNTATREVLDTDEGITDLRGTLQYWNSIEVVPMFHPSYLLRKPSKKEGSPKWQTWQDIKRVKRLYRLHTEEDFEGKVRFRE